MLYTDSEAATDYFMLS